jgi:hypothetical protein
MRSYSVIKHLDIFKDSGGSMLLVGKITYLWNLSFYSAEEAFRCPIIPTISFTTMV